MKHLSQQMISMELRRPHLRKMRRRLQRTLSSPGLSADQRRIVEREIQGLGQSKIYDPDDPPPIGAIPGGDRGPIELDLENATVESLSKEPHTTLYLYALQNDLEVVPGDTKVQIVTTILAHTQGEEP